MMALERLHDLGYRELFGHDFALINPVRVREERWQDLPVVPLRAPAFDAQPHLVPRLLPLASLDDEQQVELLERNDRQCVETGQPMFCALLASPAETRSLATSLGSRMLLDAPTGQIVWLRFHDPRVFSALAWWLDPVQLRGLLGAVQGWTWFDPRGGRWARIGRPEGEVFSGTRLRLKAEQWNRLERQPLVNRCLKTSAVDGSFPGQLRTSVERLDKYIDEAVAAGLHDQADVCQYAMLTEKHGRGWTGHPGAVRALQVARDGTQALAVGMKNLDEAELGQWMRASAGHMEEHA